MDAPPDIERLIEDWRGPLVGLLAAWGCSADEAAELAQDSLVEAYLGRARLRGGLDRPEVVGPWLRGIARNLFRARRRRRWRRREQPLADEPPGPERQEDRRLEALREALARLPEPLRAVLYLHYLEGTPVRRVAALLELPESTVESRLTVARRRLRERLAHLDPTRDPSHG